VQNWWPNFRPRPTVSAAGTTPNVFYGELWAWFGTSDFKNSIKWVDARCNSKDAAISANCDPTQGVAHTRISATLTRIGDGSARFQAVNQMRLDINKIFDDDSGMKVFPFSNDFLYWEENGIIDTELARNLIIAAGIVFVIICMLIPRPRIACIVSLGICMSIVELIGFMHWWGITVNGTSTIYLLICLGLSVDYSAHIAHIFKESYGSMQERAIQAMTRIGPSVFHALFSTILAVIVLSRSKTYVFEVFFKVLFLVTMIAGFKGLWLLPVVLSVVGGSQEKPPDDNHEPQSEVYGKQQAWDGKQNANDNPVLGNENLQDAARGA
jgi:predicted RND superfamily exporter protein